MIQTPKIQKNEPMSEVKDHNVRRVNSKLLQYFDIGTAIMVFIAVYFLTSSRTGLEEFLPRAVEPISHFTMMVVTVTILRIEFQFFHLYHFKLNHSTFVELPRVFSAISITVFFSIVILFLFESDPSLGLYTLIWGVLIAAIPISRATFRSFLRSQKRKGKYLRRTIIVGGGTMGQKIAQKLMIRLECGLLPIGFVDSVPIANNPSDLPYLGDVFELSRLIRENNAQHVLVAFPPVSDEDLTQVIRSADENGVFVSIIPRLYNLTLVDFDSDDVNGIPVHHLGASKIGHIDFVAKRMFDILLSALLILVTSPIFLLTIILIRLESPGAAIYTSPRVGKNGKIFNMIKFRSMVKDADKTQESGAFDKSRMAPQHNVDDYILNYRADDARVTNVGKWIRKYSVDELPQLINVFLGEMSIVGPRPLSPQDWEMYSETDKYRANVCPAITGLYQVLGRKEMPYDEMLRLDYLYIRNYSLWLDIKILLLTIPAVLSRRGAF